MDALFSLVVCLLVSWRFPPVLLSHNILPQLKGGNFEKDFPCSRDRRKRATLSQIPKRNRKFVEFKGVAWDLTEV